MDLADEIMHLALLDEACGDTERARRDARLTEENLARHNACLKRGAAHMSPAGCGDCEDVVYRDIEFGAGPLGLNLAPVVTSGQCRVGCRVVGFHQQLGLDNASPSGREQVKLDDVVVAVDGENVVSLPYDEILRLIRGSSARPRVLRVKNLSAEWCHLEAKSRSRLPGSTIRRRHGNKRGTATDEYSRTTLKVHTPRGRLCDGGNSAGGSGSRRPRRGRMALGSLGQSPNMVSTLSSPVPKSPAAIRKEYTTTNMHDQTPTFQSEQNDDRHGKYNARSSSSPLTDTHNTISLGAPQTHDDRSTTVSTQAQFDATLKAERAAAQRAQGKVAELQKALERIVDAKNEEKRAALLSQQRAHELRMEKWLQERDERERELLSDLASVVKEQQKQRIESAARLAAVQCTGVVLHHGCQLVIAQAEHSRSMHLQHRIDNAIADRLAMAKELECTRAQFCTCAKERLKEQQSAEAMLTNSMLVVTQLRQDMDKLQREHSLERQATQQNAAINSSMAKAANIASFAARDALSAVHRANIAVSEAMVEQKLFDAEQRYKQASEIVASLQDKYKSACEARDAACQEKGAAATAHEAVVASFQHKLQLCKHATTAAECQAKKLREQLTSTANDLQTETRRCGELSENLAKERDAVKLLQDKYKSACEARDAACQEHTKAAAETKSAKNLLLSKTNQFDDTVATMYATAVAKVTSAKECEHTVLRNSLSAARAELQAERLQHRTLRARMAEQDAQKELVHSEANLEYADALCKALEQVESNHAREKEIMRNSFEHERSAQIAALTKTKEAILVAAMRTCEKHHQYEIKTLQDALERERAAAAGLESQCRKALAEHEKAQEEQLARTAEMKTMQREVNTLQQAVASARAELQKERLRPDKDSSNHARALASLKVTLNAEHVARESVLVRRFAAQKAELLRAHKIQLRAQKDNFEKARAILANTAVSTLSVTNVGSQTELLRDTTPSFCEAASQTREHATTKTGDEHTACKLRFRIVVEQAAAAAQQRFAFGIAQRAMADSKSANITLTALREELLNARETHTKDRQQLQKQVCETEMKHAALQHKTATINREKSRLQDQCDFAQKQLLEQKSTLAARLKSQKGEYEKALQKMASTHAATNAAHQDVVKALRHQIAEHRQHSQAQRSARAIKLSRKNRVLAKELQNLKVQHEEHIKEADVERTEASCLAATNRALIRQVEECRRCACEHSARCELAEAQLQHEAQQRAHLLKLQREGKIQLRTLLVVCHFVHRRNVAMLRRAFVLLASMAEQPKDASSLPSETSQNLVRKTASDTPMRTRNTRQLKALVTHAAAMRQHLHSFGAGTSVGLRSEFAAYALFQACNTILSKGMHKAFRQWKSVGADVLGTGH